MEGLGFGMQAKVWVVVLDAVPLIELEVDEEVGKAGESLVAVDSKGLFCVGVPYSFW